MLLLVWWPSSKLTTVGVLWPTSGLWLQHEDAYPLCFESIKRLIHNNWCWLVVSNNIIKSKNRTDWSTQMEISTSSHWGFIENIDILYDINWLLNVAKNNKLFCLINYFAWFFQQNHFSLVHTTHVYTYQLFIIILAWV